MPWFSNYIHSQPRVTIKKYVFPFLISSIFDDLCMTSSSGNMSTRTKAVDYSPLLRHICRSEKARETTSRRTSRSHYLRFMIANNSFKSDYFNAQCEVFQQDEEK